jgi:hypothetical protein
MTKSPIAIEPTEPNVTLSPYSRIHLGRTYNIECNVKVRDIGMIVQEHKAILLRHDREIRDSGWETDPGEESPITETPSTTPMESRTDRGGSSNGLEIRPMKSQHERTPYLGGKDDESGEAEGSLQPADDSDDDDNSVVGIGSWASEATDLSLISAVTVEKWTEELQRIFVIDAAGESSYKRAIEDPRIGPASLERNLCRLIKVYSENVRHEAQTRSGFLVSKLLALKARRLARFVVENISTESSRNIQEQASATAEDSNQEALRKLASYTLMEICSRIPRPSALFLSKVLHLGASGIS